MRRIEPGGATLKHGVLVTLFCVAVTGLLAACHDTGNIDSAEQEARSRTLQPTDSALAAIYQRSCRNCHTVAATGAPLTGDSTAWALRLNKGVATLVDNVVNGFGGMPPFGLCMDCDADQLEALTRFMSGAGNSR